MEPQVDGPIVVASLLILAVLVGSAVLWVRQAKLPAAEKEDACGVAPWDIGWVNFGIFLCAIVIAVFLAQNLGAALLLDGDDPAPQELTPELAVAAVLLLQVPMLAVFYGARKLYPAHYADSLSRQSLPLLRSARQAFPLFIMLLPVIWVATLIWSNLLLGLEAAGLVDEVEPQQLITLFAEGGNPLAMAALVLMAVLLAPFVEEIIFRGCLYRFLKSKGSLLSAQILSGAIFAMMHGNLLSFLPLLLVGVLLARVYEKSGNIWVAIWFHAYFNAFSLAMLLITSFSDNLPAT